MSESRFFVLDPNKSKNGNKKVYDDSHKVRIDIYDPYPGFNGENVEPAWIYGPITGYMTDQFSYSMRADYEKMFNASSIFPGIQNIASLDRGENLGKMGYATKQFYTGSGYVEISVKIRFHNDWISEQNGDGNAKSALDTANVLLATVMPSSNIKANNAMFQDKESGLLGTSFILANGILSAASDKNAEFLGKNPPLVWIEIGNYFKKSHMTVRSVNITPSQEFMKFSYGGNPNYVEPLYVDVDLSLTSLYAATISTDDSLSPILWDKYGTGFKRGDVKARVEIVESLSDTFSTVTNGAVSSGKSLYSAGKNILGLGDK